MEVTRRMSEERDLQPHANNNNNNNNNHVMAMSADDKERRLQRWKDKLGPRDDAETAVMTASGASAIKVRRDRPSRSNEAEPLVIVRNIQPSSSNRFFRSHQQKNNKQQTMVVAKNWPTSNHVDTCTLLNAGPRERLTFDARHNPHCSFFIISFFWGGGTGLSRTFHQVLLVSKEMKGNFIFQV